MLLTQGSSYITNNLTVNKKLINLVDVLLLMALKRRGILSYFTFKRVAEGYAKYRPYYHPIVMQRIKKQLETKAKFQNALDVGCGTGLSSKALLEVAKNVTGIDGSAEMIDVAKKEDKDDIKYLQSKAEELNFNNNTFDIITLCGSINWIDRTLFLPEAYRVLKNLGWLIIYDNFITDRMTGNARYTDWYNKEYLTRFPKPPRNEDPFTKEESSKYGFELMCSDTYSNQFNLSFNEYIEFMLTQSNVIVATDMGTENIETARAWMKSTLKPILNEKVNAFEFDGYILYLQK